MNISAGVIQIIQYLYNNGELTLAQSKEIGFNDFAIADAIEKGLIRQEFSNEKGYYWYLPAFVAAKIRKGIEL